MSKISKVSTKKLSEKNLWFSLLSQFITIIMGLLIPRLTMVGYGSEVNGLLNSVNQFISYLVLFEAGVQTVAMQVLYKSLANDDKQLTNEVLATVNLKYRVVAIYYFIGLLLLSLTFPFFSRTSISFITVFLVVFFSGLPSVISFFFQGKFKILMMAEGKNYLIININLIISVLSHICKIVLLYLGFNISIIIFCSFAISLIQTLYVMYYAKKYYSWINISAKPNYSLIKENRYAIIHQISILIFNNIDVLVLTTVCGLQVVSVYSIYKMIVGYISTTLKLPISSSSFAFGQLYNKSKEKFILYNDAFEVAMSILSCSAFATTIIAIIPFIKLYTANVNDINYVDYVIAYLFVFGEMLSVFRQPMYNLIEYDGKFRDTAKYSIVEAILNLIGSVAFVFLWGIRGVLLATIVALLYRTLTIWLYGNKKILHRSLKKTISIYGVNTVILILVVLFSKLINIQLNNYITVLGFSMIILVVSFIICLILNCLFFKKEMNLILLFAKGKLKSIQTKL